MIGEHSSGNSTILARLNCKMLPLFCQMIAHRWGDANKPLVLGELPTTLSAPVTRLGLCLFARDGTTKL
jgi:hypothetical protein